MDDKLWVIGAITLIALGGMIASAYGVKVESIMTHSFTALGALAVGRRLT